ncbi:MAG: YHS domain-containing protein [Chitinophagales bacterium]|nr:YHS domain-containing protein [Chitinophagales bacterium]MDW8273882.1 YHS domain-containing protein [Chitinophagales bacterium]
MSNHLVALPFSILLLGACQHLKHSEEKHASHTSDKPSLTLSMLSTNHDFVCGMDLERDDFIADTTLYNGKVYGFCASECKKLFLENPQKYLSSK